MTDIAVFPTSESPAPTSYGAPISSRVAALRGADRRLLGAFIAVSLAPLLFGLSLGLVVALARGGVIGFDPEIAYRLLTLHGASAFFWWLYLAQVALMLGFAAGEPTGGLKARPLALAALIALIAGFGLSEYTAMTKTALLYDANPDLGMEDAPAVAGMAGGYLLLALGLVLSSLSAIATALDARDSEGGGLSAMGFGVLAWAGFLIVSGIAAVNAFLPNLMWALGRGEFPSHAATDWHILFHNLHYLPLMASVLTWYALTRETTGVSSAFGAGFSKLVFASYLVFVPPTSLYHMFLEPGLSENVRVVGTLLSLFVSVPTLIAFLIIVSSLEISTRERGAANGLFGWIGRLPWSDPAFAAMGVAMLSTLVGLVFAFVLIQEKFAPLLSDTMFVPGYFHFFAVGAVTQTFLAGLMVIVPALRGRAWRPRLQAWAPWLVFAGLVVFGAAGMLAGLAGVPRRTFDIAYEGAAPDAWRPLMQALAVGAAIFAVGLAVEAVGVAAAFFAPGIALPRATTAAAPPALQAGSVAAWTGPIAIVVLVLAMSGATIGAFELMQSLPIHAVGGHSGH